MLGNFKNMIEGRDSDGRVGYTEFEIIKRHSNSSRKYKYECKQGLSF